MEQPLLIDRVVSWLFPRAGMRRQMHRNALSIMNSYEGASKSRRTEGWRTTGSNANDETSRALPVLRNRSRDLVRNNPYASKAVAVIANNTVGTGIKPKVLVNRKPKQLVINALIKQHLGTTAIDVDGSKDFFGLQGLAMRTVAEAGEVLVRRRFRRPSDGFPLPFQIELIEADHLDDNRDEVLNNGHRIIQGVQFDAIGKRVGYWLFPEHPGSLGSAFRFGESRFVSASEILHIRREDRPGQVRGVPWGAPVIIKLRDFDEYDDYQLMRQKVAACYSVFVYQDEFGPGQDTPTQKASNNPLVDRLEPGMIELLPGGKRVEFAEPPGVDGYKEYSSVQLHAVAAGYGVTYEALTGEMSEVNFASGRMSRLEFQNNVDCWRRQMFIPQFCDGVWNWFEQALEIMGLGDSSMTVRWFPPRRQMINPEKEVPALRDAVRSAQLTPSGMLRELGVDPDEFYLEWAEDAKHLDALNLILDIDPRKVSRAGLSQPVDQVEAGT